MEALREFIKEWLYSSSGDGFGYGDGDGSGNGDDYGVGSGFGDGGSSGCGVGFSEGFGDGDGLGCGDGFGYGDGDDYGGGGGFAGGGGFGAGSGYDVKSFAGEDVYMIDGVQTIIRKIRFGAAFGVILNSDLTLTRCWVVKGNNQFAHGTTLKEAREALAEKLFDCMSEDERIVAFWKEHNRTDKYNGRDLWAWHHRLTGSCEMGRNQFCADRGIDIDGTEWTVDEFIELCKDSYGGRIIKRLK